MTSFDIVKRVRITEKSTRQSASRNCYTLVVDRRANKVQIRQAVQELFKVKVIAINTMNVRGKARRQFQPSRGKAPDWKKAIVTLKDGDKISLA